MRTISLQTYCTEKEHLSDPNGTRTTRNTGLQSMGAVGCQDPGALTLRMRRSLFFSFLKRRGDTAV